MGRCGGEGREEQKKSELGIIREVLSRVGIEEEREACKQPDPPAPDAILKVREKGEHWKTVGIEVRELYTDETERGSFLLGLSAKWKKVQKRFCCWINKCNPCELRNWEIEVSVDAKKLESLEDKIRSNPDVFSKNLFELCCAAVETDAAKTPDARGYIHCYIWMKYGAVVGANTPRRNGQQLPWKGECIINREEVSERLLGDISRITLWRYENSYLKPTSPLTLEELSSGWVGDSRPCLLKAISGKSDKNYDWGGCEERWLFIAATEIVISSAFGGPDRLFKGDDGLRLRRKCDCSPFDRIIFYNGHRPGKQLKPVPEGADDGITLWDSGPPQDS